MDKKLKQALEMVLITEIATDNIRERMNDTESGIEIPQRLLITSEELVKQFVHELEEENQKDRQHNQLR